MPDKQDRLAQLLSLISGQAKKLREAREDLTTFVPQWKGRTLRLLGGFLVPDELKLLDAINTETFEKDRAAYLSYLKELDASVREFPEHYLLPDSLPEDEDTNRGRDREVARQLAPSKNVFVVHGHDALAKLELARTIEKLRLSPVVLHEQPNEGKTIIEKFERDASRVSFAVVLLTPDDEGHPFGKTAERRSRARQNVILELGYFSGVLGRSRVCVLYKGDVEVPSDYLGVVYINMDSGGGWKFAMAKELKQAGLPIDLNDLA